MKKRIVMLLSVVALMVVMLAMTVTPAFAKSTQTYTCTSIFGTHTGVPKEGAKQGEKGGFYLTCEKERKGV